MSEQLRQEFVRVLIEKYPKVYKVYEGLPPSWNEQAQKFVSPSCQDEWEWFQAGSAALQEKVERYEKALEFYADTDNYSDDCPGRRDGEGPDAEWECDCGYTAREALSSPTNEQEGDKRED